MTMKRTLAATAISALLLSSVAMPAAADATPAQPVDVTGNYDINFFLTGDATAYTHDASLTQTGSDVDGNGGHPANGSHTFAWDITEGSIDGNKIELTADYTAGPNTEDTVMTMVGKINPDGSMEGTWEDNYGDETRTGTWETVSGSADVFIPEECDDLALDGEWIVGSDKSETLNGTNDSDLIYALDGSDNVKGNNGADCIVGGDGSDSLKGGNGADVILGNDGSDKILGEDGADKLYGHDGPDSINGGNGSDDIWGGEGADSLLGGDNADDLWGGEGADSLKGEAGQDTLDGESGMDSANGGAGNNDACNAESERQCEA